MAVAAALPGFGNSALAVAAPAWSAVVRAGSGARLLDTGCHFVERAEPLEGLAEALGPLGLQRLACYRHLMHRVGE